MASAAPAPQPTPDPGQTLERVTDVEQSVSWGALISVKRDGTDGETYPLSGEWMDIGRSGAHLSFDDDSFLARRHARIECGDEGTQVIPLDDLNGVYRRLDSEEELADGAMILAGREVLRFELVSEQECEATPLVRHGVAMFGSPPRKPWGRLLQLLPNTGVRDIRYLVDIEFIIGREEGDFVFRDDAFLSRRHARLSWKDGACSLQDLESSNGTFVRLAGPTRLDMGDHLRLGDQLFRFESGSPNAS